MNSEIKAMVILVLMLVVVVSGCTGNEDAASDGSIGGDIDRNGDSTGDADTDTDADTDSDADTDTNAAGEPTALRIEAECGYGATAGDCNGVVDGFNVALPGQDGADAIPLLKETEGVVGYFYAGAWLAFPDVDLTGYTAVALRVASANNGGEFEVRLDAADGELIATIPVPNTGDWSVFERVEVNLAAVEGVHTVYLVSADNGSYNGDVDWIEFFTGEAAQNIDTEQDTGSDEDTGFEPDTDSGSKFDHPMFVGNITTYGQVRDDFATYWDQITPENEGKWGSVEGTRDQYNWSGVDRAYNYAREHGLMFKQHTFVWGAQSPSWINDLSAEETAEEIEEWIHDFCERYPDTEMIDVVNEATPGHQPAGYAQKAFGDDWIIDVFRLAREHCPNSILILNDYNVLTWNTNEFITMATPAVEAGVVDAIGLQAHGFATWSLNDLKNNMDKIVALGLPIYISEYDADVENDEEQRRVMEEQFTYFYEHPQVKGITLWGYLVGGTWVENSGLIHSDGTFRPAMTWLMDYLGR